MSKSGPKPFRTNIRDVPLVPGLKKEDGWVDMKVQFLIDEKTASSGRMLVGWTVLPPGAAHEHHRHANVDEFWIVIKGEGVMYTDDGEEASGEVTSCSRRQDTGTVSGTLQTRMSSWPGAGLAPDPLRTPVTKYRNRPATPDQCWMGASDAG